MTFKILIKTDQNKKAHNFDMKESIHLSPKSVKTDRYPEDFLLSVIMPAYNERATINEALEPSSKLPSKKK